MLANVGHLCVLVMDALLGIQSNGEVTQDHKAVHSSNNINSAKFEEKNHLLI